MEKIETENIVGWLPTLSPVWSLGEDLRRLYSLLVSVLLTVMAVFVAPSTLDRIRAIFSRRVVDGENPNRLFSLPVFLRKDGAILRVGAIVQQEQDSNEGKRYCIKDILVSYDLEQTFACLVPVEMDPTQNQPHKVLMGEELMLDIFSVVLVPEDGLARSVALDGMQRMLQGIQSYPTRLQRLVRRHQLCSALRRDVQRFLSGFSIAQSWTLGTVDWRMDPGILGLEKETAFTVDFHIEKFDCSLSHVDLLLGDCWDVRRIPGTDGYRAVITLEVSVDVNQDIKVTAHAVLCTHPLKPSNHRVETLKELHSAKLTQPSTGTRSSENTLNRPETSLPLLGTAKSLTWEEFRNLEELNWSSTESSPRRETSFKTVSLDNTYLQPCTSTAAASLQHLLQQANFNSQNFYFYSPVGKGKESRTGGKGGKRQKTSTPAEEPADDDIGQDQDSTQTLELENPVFEVLNPEELRKSVSNTDTTGSSWKTLSNEETEQTEEKKIKETKLKEIEQAKDEEVIAGDEIPLIKDIEIKSREEEIESGKYEKLEQEYYVEIQTGKDEEAEQAIGKEIEPTEAEEMELGKVEEIELGKVEEIELGKVEEIEPAKVEEIELVKDEEMEENEDKKIDVVEEKELGIDKNEQVKDQDNKLAASVEPETELEIHRTESSQFSASPNLLPSNTETVNKLVSGPVVSGPAQVGPENQEESGIPAVDRQISSPMEIEGSSEESPETTISKMETEESETTKSDLNDISDNNNDNSLINKVSETSVCDIQGPSILPSPRQLPGTSILKVEEYINSLPAYSPHNASFSSLNNTSASPHTFTPDRLDLSGLDNTLSGFKSPGLPEARRGRLSTDEDGNLSVCSSRSRASRSSRVSDLGSLVGRFGAGAVSSFYGANTEPFCPFPDEWQYNTIPEVIENDDEID